MMATKLAKVTTELVRVRVAVMLEGPEVTVRIQAGNDGK
jgi:hypothetical protein